MSPVGNLQDLSDRLDRIASRFHINPRSVDSFQVSFNDTTKGATISFKVISTRGISTIAVKQNSSKDLGSAVLVNTWDARALSAGQVIKFEDTQKALKTDASIYYWLECHPFLDDFDPVVIGPQGFTNTLDQGSPNAIADFDVSHEAVSGGVVQVGISFKPPVGDDRFGSCKIAIAGYNGVAATVEIAQSATSPFRFALKQTGETVTLSAIAVSQNGIESTQAAPTKSLTLGAAATVPAKIMGASATELSTGVQVMFPAGPESNITQYQIYRGRRGGGFAAASSIGTVAPTGASAYTFLDTGGLGGQYEWYVFAVNSAGNGANSDRILPDPVSLTSADQPPNAPSNTSNFATVDSIDAGTDATIRIYGAGGGVGSSWTRPTGFGSETFAGGTITHKAYATKYWVVWDKSGQQYLAFTSSTDALGDNYAFAGTVTTVSAGGGGGTSGGGGVSGGNGGGNKLPQS